MATEIKMPQLGESVTEGTIGRWLKQPGDTVEKYEPLLEVVTDKVDTEVPAPATGTLEEIVVAEGETVRVGTVLARMRVAGAAETSDAASEPQLVPTMAESAQQPSGNGQEAPPAQRDQPAARGSRSATISPVVARLVGEHNLDVSQIEGTGANGRVTKQDVMRFIDGGDSVQPAVETQPAVVVADEEQAAEAVQEDTQRAFEPQTPAPQPTSAPAQRTVELASAPPAATAEPSKPTPAPLPEDAELVPLSPMRRAIAEHMVRSVRTAPHVTSVVEIDMGQVVAHRSAHRDSFERQGVRLTYTAYFVQATVAALQAAPVLNGSFTDDGIAMHQRIHIGVAVALDEGLIVPVVRDADEKNLLGLARAVNDLADRARSRRLRSDETQGGTFTVTNHGVSGSIFAMPIINQPQSGILGVGAIVKRPVVVTQDGVDAIAIRPMCYCSLTFDHRIADGAIADGFLMALKRELEQFKG